MLAGPYATMMLADLGAEVIKIEPPGGEISRQVSDSYFASLNRGKRSVCLDLNTEAGQRRLGELVAESHALLVNLKPSAIRRLGLTYDALRRYNERIVCVALTGYGLDGGDEPGVRLRDPGRDRHRRADRRSRRAADAARLLVGRQLHGPDRRAGTARPDHLRPRRPGRRVAARRDAVAAELPRVGLPQRRRRAAPASRSVRTRITFRRSCFRRPTAIWRCSSRTTRSGSRLRPRPSIDGFATMAERVARRDEVLAVVTAALADRHRQGLGSAAAPARHPGRRGALVARGAGGRPRNRGHRGRFQAGRQPDPDRRIHARLPAAAIAGPALAERNAGLRSLVDDGDDSVSGTPWQVRMYPSSISSSSSTSLSRMVALPSFSVADAGAAVACLAGERRREPGAPGALQQRLTRHARGPSPSCGRGGSSRSRSRTRARASSSASPCSSLRL